MKLKIKESYEPITQYEYVKSKSVLDSEGWNDDYTMYYDVLNDKYVFVFGDNDIYNPNEDEYIDFDWECDTKSEAEDWFSHYKGPGEDY